MKRRSCRLGCCKEEESVKSVPMQLRSRNSNSSSSSSSGNNVRVFECKTCCRQFESFQALGGHRASHKKPSTHVRAHGLRAGLRARSHECSICGLEFSIGQALGGHMRRHRGADRAVGGGSGEKRVWLDLNLPPPPPTEEETDCRMMGFGLENPIPMLEYCHY